MLNNVLINVPVKSVNGLTGTIVLDAESVGAITESDLSDYVLDADADDVTYGRLNNEWVSVESESTGIDEAPVTGYPYIRKNEAWARPAIVTSGVSSTTIGIKIEDANAIDSYTIPAATSTEAGLMTASDKNTLDSALQDADSDGTTYGRQDGAWVEVTSSGDSDYYADVYCETTYDAGALIRQAIGTIDVSTNKWTVRVHGDVQINGSTSFDTVTIDSTTYYSFCELDEENMTIDFTNCNIEVYDPGLPTDYPIILVYVSEDNCRIKGLTLNQSASDGDAPDTYVAYIDSDNVEICDSSIILGVATSTSTRVLTGIYSTDTSNFSRISNIYMKLQNAGTSDNYMLNLGIQGLVTGCAFHGAYTNMYLNIRGNYNCIMSCYTNNVFANVSGDYNFITASHIDSTTNITDTGLSNVYSYNYA